MKKTYLKILYEDSDILAIEKPAGIMVHADGKKREIKEETLCDILLRTHPEIEGVGEPLKLSSGEEISRPGIVHRLDRETSGVMLIARTPEAHSFLKKQFQNHEVQKEYRAFVWGKLKPEHGKIDMPLGRSKKDFRQYVRPARARGEMREALTYYDTLHVGVEEGKNISYIKAIPKTGRTHQIRAHFTSIGHPIVCDRLYGKSFGTALGFDRLALHSFSVRFKNMAGKEVEVGSSLPEDFETALSLLGS